VRLTDTHCHLYFRHFRKDLEDVLARAEDAGVERILVPGVDLETSRLAVQLSEEHNIIYSAVGVQPNSGKIWTENTLAELEKLADHPKVVGIGEIGLDYYREQAPRDLQLQILQEQLLLASEKDLPVILHVRNRSDSNRNCMRDLLHTLEHWLSEDPRSKESDFLPGVIHSFSGNLRESHRVLKAGFYIGIVGFVTFKSGELVREVIRNTDLSRILVETDGPFISPHPYRGKRNEPAHVRYIIDKISEVTGITQEVAAEQTAVNAGMLFKWE
jgi:TatD DNase family protein